jgi:hypothetical protein
MTIKAAHPAASSSVPIFPDNRYKCGGMLAAFNRGIVLHAGDSGKDQVMHTAEIHEQQATERARGSADPGIQADCAMINSDLHPCRACC